MSILTETAFEFKKKLNGFFFAFLLFTSLIILSPGAVQAGGGLVLEGDVCIIWIDFYSAHFTAYQPASRGNEQFCQQLPDTGETIFVLDYLHPSLKEVGVSFRIIRDVTGQGSYVKLKHVEAISDIDRHTVFYQQPVIREDASLKIEHDFIQDGTYIGIVTAGHPSNDTQYTAGFSFEVGGSSYDFLLPVVVLVIVVLFFLVRRIAVVRKSGTRQGTGL